MCNVLCFADDEEDVRSMENVMLEYAALDRELNHYMRAIEETVDQVNSTSVKVINLYPYISIVL